MAWYNSMNDFLGGMSGMKKMKYGGDLYDSKEAAKLRARKEKLYGELGEERTRFGEQASDFLGKYGKEGAKAEEYYGRARTGLGRAEADVGRSRRYQRSADAMIGDKTFYGDLKKRSSERRGQYKDAMLEQQALRGKIGKPAGPGAFSQSIMDAFKTVSDSARQQMAPRMAEMRKTNPVAAAKMMMDFDKQTMQGLGKAQQKGFFGDREMNMQNLAMEEGMLMRGTGLLGNQAQEDQYMAQHQQQQIANYGAAGSQALQTGAMEGDLARGQMAIGGQYDQRSRDALGAGMQYEGMGYNALQDQTSMTRADLDRQSQFRMSDRAARARTEQFNAQRQGAGLGNVLKLGSMAIGGYGAWKQAGLAAAQTAYYKGQTKGGGPPGTDVSGLDNGPTSNLQTVDFKSEGPTGKYASSTPQHSNNQYLPFNANNFMRPSSRKSWRGWGEGQHGQNPTMSGNTPYQAINHDAPSLAPLPTTFGNKPGLGNNYQFNFGGDRPITDAQPWEWFKERAGWE